MTDDPPSLTAQLRAAAISAGLTARRLEKLGVPLTTAQRFLKGEHVRSDTLDKIARILGVRITKPHRKQP